MTEFVFFGWTLSLIRSVGHIRTLTWLCPNVFFISDELSVWFWEQSAPTWRYKERQKRTCSFIKQTRSSYDQAQSGGDGRLVLNPSLKNNNKNTPVATMEQWYCIGYNCLLFTFSTKALSSEIIQCCIENRLIMLLKGWSISRKCFICLSLGALKQARKMFRVTH